MGAVTEGVTSYVTSNSPTTEMDERSKSRGVLASQEDTTNGQNTATKSNLKDPITA